MTELVDQHERTLIREDLNRSMLVEAAAGTGKTTELIHRIVNVLSQGRAQIQQIIAVTFTEKAAGELKLRLRTHLEIARKKEKDPSRQEHPKGALLRLEEARINTIHGLCADLLRERPVEAGIDPRFEPLSEAEGERMYRDAFGSWLQKALEDPPEGVRRSLRRSSENGSIERLRSAGSELLGWRDFPASA